MSTAIDQSTNVVHREPSKEYNEKSSSIEEGIVEAEEKFDDHDV